MSFVITPLNQSSKFVIRVEPNTEQPNRGVRTVQLCSDVFGCQNWIG